jgi:hypothetical protein
MVKYTLGLSKFIRMSPGIQQGRVSVVDFPHIFGRTFLPSFLADGVHLVEDQNMVLARFLAGLLESERVPKPLEVKDVRVRFSDLLAIRGIEHEESELDIELESNQAPVDECIEMADMERFNPLL